MCGKYCLLDNIIIYIFIINCIFYSSTVLYNNDFCMLILWAKHTP